MTQPSAATPLLPICTRPVQIHPNPTVWRNDDLARQWIDLVTRRHAPATPTSTTREEAAR